MFRMRAVTAVLLAAASVVATAAPTASAQEGGGQEGIERPAILDQVELSTNFEPCGSTVSVPNCVNYAFDTAEAAIDTAERVYQRAAERYVCDVHWILTGEECPDGTDVL